MVWCLQGKNDFARDIQSLCCETSTEWRLCSASKEVVRAEGKERGHLKQLQANNVVLKAADAIG